MKNLIILGLGAAAGYFLGSREGRKNLDRMATNAKDYWNDPKTQEQVRKAADTVSKQAPVVAEKAGRLADQAAEAAKEKAPQYADRIGKAQAAAHSAADKGAAATQSAAGKAADSAAKGSDSATGGRHATGEEAAPSTARTSKGDVLSDPSESLEAEGGGPARA